MERPQVKIDDKVIYVPRANSEPVITKVSRLTPTGQIGIPEVKGSFRVSRYGDQDKYVQGSMWSNKATVYLFSAKRLAKLHESARLQREHEQEQKVEAERKAAERQAKDEAQAAEIRRVCANQLPFKSQETLPDGSRLAILTVPVNPAHADKQFDLLIVHIKDREDFNWRTSEKTMKPVADSTYITANRGFSGRSSVRGDNDDEILWALVQDRYFDYS